jgi:hypothetical protein
MSENITSAWYSSRLTPPTGVYTHGNALTKLIVPISGFMGLKRSLTLTKRTPHRLRILFVVSAVAGIFYLGMRTHTGRDIADISKGRHNFSDYAVQLRTILSDVRGPTQPSYVLELRPSSF